MASARNRGGSARSASVGEAAAAAGGGENTATRPAAAGPDALQQDYTEEYLKKLYFDQSAPASYQGLKKLWTQVKLDPERPAGLTQKKLKQWLDRQEVYQVHSQTKQSYETEALIVEYSDQLWDIDILVLPNDKPGINRNYKYLLGVIDLFSRYAWVRLLKKKTATETAKAFKSILAEGRKCEALRGDAGTEFLGAPFKEMLEEENIPYITAYGHVKANFIERWFKTFEQKLHRYFYHNTTSNFVDVVQDIVLSYNNTVHRTTGYRPAEVDEHNTIELYDRVYKPILDKRAAQRFHPSFHAGDLVRISLFKDKFKRSYTQNWSEEVFEIWYVVKSHPPRYKIRDLKQENIQGSFYKEDLKPVNAQDAKDINWKIERVISTRKVKGRRPQSLIKWYGFSEKFNSYIDTADLKKYPRWK